MINNHKKYIHVFVVHPNGEFLVQRLQSELSFVNVEYFPTHCANDVNESVWRKCEVLYTEKALPLPEQAPRLKWIQFHFAGIDNFITAPVFTKPNVIITTLSGVSALPMGEYVISYILAFGHRIFEMKEHQRQRNWPDNRFDVLCPSEIRKSTLGIIGYGSVGREVARLAKAFGACVIATKKNTFDLSDLGFYHKGTGDPDGSCLDHIYSTDKLYELLSLSDYVVVTVPLTKHTKNMIGKQQLNSMKENAVLIDVSRGGVIDHDALIEVLLEGRIAGAVLDVFTDEPLPKNHPLWNIPNVIITPHISGYSRYYFEDASQLFIENLHLFADGKPLLNQYNKLQGY